MNHKYWMLFLLLSLSSLAAQETYQDLPLIHANGTYSEYKVGDTWYRGYWSIAPEVAHDTLGILCFSDAEAFAFKTDRDSIAFDLQIGEAKEFYVLVQDSQYAHTIIVGEAFTTQAVRYDDENRDDRINIHYQSSEDDFLDDLRQEYPLQKIINRKESEIDQILSILHWTNSQWEHNGSNSPSKNDAITILNEAKAGNRFPCFAYAIVLRDQLSAYGFSARTVYLKTKDAEYRQNSPGHVATEVYVPELEKWVFLDGQFGIMPVLDGKPLNAVELQNAIANRYEDFELLSKVEVSKREYVEFVYDYLYYLDTSLDNRLSQKDRQTIDGKRSLMLVPQGAKNLERIDFWKMKVDYCLYTHSLKDFYAEPMD